MAWLLNRQALLRLWTIALTAPLWNAALGADQPLPVRIDEAVEAAHVGPPAPLADDAEFLRRAWLDLAGIVPPVDEVRAFLDDPSSDKRARAVERLLSGPRYALHMAEVFDVMLMERRRDQHVPAAEWQAYLQASFAENKPYTELVREILGADGVDADLRPAAKFSLDRSGEPNLLTRDIGRIFFGRDLQCAQCHDHPLVEDYRQAEYFGLFAFLNRSFVFTDKKDNNKAYFAEKAEGEATFKSVFTGYEGKTGPRLPGALPLDEPAFPPGEEYEVPPADDVRPVPKYSRRARLAEEASSGANRAFNRNIANRLWAHMMGRGLVHPPDLHHSDNPPSHPELLDMLATEFAAMNYDVREFLRALGLTRTYQRSIEMPEVSIEQVARAAALRAELEERQEQLASVAGESRERARSAAEAAREVEDAYGPLPDALAQAAAALAEAKTAADEAARVLSETRTQLGALREGSAALAEAVWSGRQALEQLPEETELAEAIEKLQTRASQASAEVAALEQAETEQSTAATATAEQAQAAETATAEAQAQHDAAREARDAALTEEAAAEEQYLTDRYALKALERRLEGAQHMKDYAVQALEGEAEAASETRASLAERWTEQHALGTLKPLTPEQLAWSTMQALGPVQQQAAAAAAEWEAANPPGDSPDEAARARARADHVERTVYEKLKGNVGAFVNLFGAGAGQPQDDFFATADQALFFANAGTVQSWLAPGGGNLTERANRLEDPAAVAEEIYLSVLSRRPRGAETADVAAHLEGRTEDRLAAIQEVVWALLTAAEFRFNH